MLKWELWRARRDKSLLLSLGLFFICCLLATGYGRAQLNRQNLVIGQLENLLRESDEAYFEARFKDDEDIGRVHYYLKTPTAHRARAEAALSLGQRDLHSYHQSVGLRSLYTNLFDAGFENPARSEAGHFDFAFVLVFLFPLVIIASNHDLLSRERERGTLRSLRASGCKLSHLFLTKLLARFLLTAAVLATSLLMALVFVGAPLSVWPTWLLVCLAYQSIWFALAGLVVSSAWSSARSAGALLGLWTVLTIITPALLSLALPREATESGAALTIQCRQIVAAGWDLDKGETQRKAQERFDGYDEAPVRDEKFTWSWYYAMHDAADSSVADLVDRYFRGLREKDEKAYHFSILSPSVRTQLLLDRLAGTDLKSHLDYYQHVSQARRVMQEESLPRVFRTEKLDKAQLFRLHDEVHTKVFTPRANPESSRGVLELILLGLVSLGLAAYRLLGLEGRLEKSW